MSLTTIKSGEKFILKIGLSLTTFRLQQQCVIILGIKKRINQMMDGEVKGLEFLLQNYFNLTFITQIIKLSFAKLF